MRCVSLSDRRRGVLVGTIVGDAFGKPLEGAPAGSLQSLLRRRAHQPAPWRYTDDGAMAIALAQSLRATGTIDPTHLLASFRAHYEPARGFGRGMKLAFAAFDQGVHWTEIPYVAWPEGSRGNGGATRVAAVALRPWLDLAALRSAATLATRVTHAHQEAVSAAQVQVVLIALILQEPALAEFPLELLDRIASVLDDSSTALALIDKVRCSLLSSASPAELARTLGTSTLAVESVPVALAAFLQNHSSFERAIVHAASLGGDVDSICALVGAAAGALHGFSGIPSLWIDALAGETPSVHALCALADDLAELAPAPFSGSAASRLRVGYAG